MIGPHCECPHDDAPRPLPILRDVLTAAVGGALAAVVSEVGQGLRETNSTTKETDE